MPKKIQLFWWSERKLMDKSKENYGDLLGKYLVEKISEKEIVWVQPKKQKWKTLFKPVYVTIGSVLSQVNKKCIVWGSGIITKDQYVEKAKFLAVRGPETRERLLELGYDVPKTYGDPALLLPEYYYPEVKKKYDYGIIPHYTDFQLIQEKFKEVDSVLVVDLMTNDIEATTNVILQCRKVISSSLHGIIVSHAYGIPAVWVKLSNNLFGDDVKFKDYFASIKLPFKPKMAIKKDVTKIDLESLFKSEVVLPKEETIKELQDGLMQSCPFVKQ